MSPSQSGCQAGAMWNYSALLQHALDWDFKSDLFVGFVFLTLFPPARDPSSILMFLSALEVSPAFWG